MFKSAVIFRVRADGSVPSSAQFEEQMTKRRFVPCGASQIESFGWVRPRGEKHSPLLESVGGQYILHLMTESKMLPGSVVKEALKVRLDKIEEESGRRPKGKLAKEIKEEVIAALLPKAFTTKKLTRVWLDPVGKFLVIEAGTSKAADRLVKEVLFIMSEIGEDATLGSLNTKETPAAAMSRWLTTQEAPEGFTVDRECALKSPSGEKAAVSYSRHTLDINEVVEHINQGKSPTKLALTHDSRVSFVLTDNLALKKIELLDVVADDAGKDKNGFDADVAIFTGEMRKLIPQLIEVLGGETEIE
jgi:recombination associated protein RdgC